jgi:histone H3/H4
MTDGSTQKETLVVVSKLKNYIREASGMNTSGAVADVLSDIVRNLCNDAIERAKNDGRKTVMDRDFGLATTTTTTTHTQVAAAQ